MKQKKKKRLIILSVILVIYILLSAWGFKLETVRYSVKSNKVNDVRIVFISDLHNCFYGGFDQSGLFDAVEAEEPDIVLFGGDMIDQWGGMKYALRFMKMIKEKYPCAYTAGNHEEVRKDKKTFYNKVRELGIPVLMGENQTFEVNGQKICVFGVLTDYAMIGKENQLSKCINELDTNCYNILLIHNPELIGNVNRLEKKFDLILSGHAHGGQWRLPKILEQGTYAPGQGIFPDYTCGMYEYGDTVHIISKGLAKPLRMIFIPRIFNHPEITVIDL